MRTIIFLKKSLVSSSDVSSEADFFIRIHPESRLDVDFFICIIDNKIDFFLRICTSAAVSDNADINGISSAQKFIIDDILHDMTGIVLTIV